MFKSEDYFIFGLQLPVLLPLPPLSEITKAHSQGWLVISWAEKLDRVSIDHYSAKYILGMALEKPNRAVLSWQKAISTSLKCPKVEKVSSKMFK